MNRRTATNVKKGRVVHKNRWEKTPNYWNTYQETIQIDIERPGKGYKHVLKKRDIKKFLDILPNREEIDIEFDAVLLAAGDYCTDGWYRNGVIAICAWTKELTASFNRGYFNAHKEIFEKLEVKYNLKKGMVVCEFTEWQVKAYQLLHIFLHELGYNDQVAKNIPR